MRGATTKFCTTRRRKHISTHAPHAGSDDASSLCSLSWTLFQPTLPMRGATSYPSSEMNPRHLFQPTLPMRGATVISGLGGVFVRISTHAPHAGSDASWYCHVSARIISTHAPHAGSDGPISTCSYTATHFNPRSPCGERPHSPHTAFPARAFQPTLPMRGATLEKKCCGFAVTNFNPRSPCGERPARSSIPPMRNYFNPRSPCGERLHFLGYDIPEGIISTHAPHAGSDVNRRDRYDLRINISTHAPHAGSDARLLHHHRHH